MEFGHVAGTIALEIEEIGPSIINYFVNYNHDTQNE